MTTDISNVAKQIGTTETAVSNRVNLILSENGGAWSQSGLSDEQQNNRAIRIAARQLTTEKRKIASSGCVELSGVFVVSPPYKDWARMAYTKMSKTLSDADDSVITTLVENGTIVLYEPNDSGFNRKANSSLMNRIEFSPGLSEAQVTSLPNNTFHLEEKGIHFYIVADNSMPKFPSGDDNYRYGRPRPLSEPERTCLFLGSLDGGEVDLFEIKFSGKDALTQQPTYTPGTIPVKPGKPNAKTGNGRAWTKTGVSIFSEDPSVASLLPSEPFTAEGEGFMRNLVGKDGVLDSFGGLLPYYEAHNGDDDWWEQRVIVCGEVSHIDADTNGSTAIVVGDYQDFSAPAIEFRVPQEHSHLIDFSVGSGIALIGAVWKTSEGEARFTTHGWYVYDGLAPSVSIDSVSGWDE